MKYSVVRDSADIDSGWEIFEIYKKDKDTIFRYIKTISPDEFDEAIKNILFKNNG